jgi:hypothetical protein
MIFAGKRGILSQCCDIGSWHAKHRCCVSVLRRSKKEHHLISYRAQESRAATLIFNKYYIKTGIKSVVNLRQQALCAAPKLHML